MSDSYEIVINPPQNVWRILSNEFVRTDGWDFSENDYNNWQETIDVTYYVAVDKESRNPLGCVSIAKWIERDSGEPFFHIGQFYVMGHARSLGIGRKLFRMAMDLGKGFNIVLTMANKYEHVFGFNKILEPWQLMIMFRPENVQLLEARKHEKFEIKSVPEVDFTKIHAFDEKICCLDRRRYLEKNLTHPAASSLVAVDSSENVLGFICLKLATRDNVNVSGFYAENQETALHLLNEGLRKLFENKAKINNVLLVFSSDNHRVMEITNKLLHGKFSLSAWDRQQFTMKTLRPPSAMVYSVIDGAHSYV